MAQKKSGPKTNLKVSKKFRSKKNLRQKLFLVKKFGKKNFGHKAILVKTNFVTEKLLDPKKTMGLKKVLGLKKY